MTGGVARVIGGVPMRAALLLVICLQALNGTSWGQDRAEQAAARSEDAAKRAEAAADRVDQWGKYIAEQMKAARSIEQLVKAARSFSDRADKDAQLADAAAARARETVSIVEAAAERAQLGAAQRPQGGAGVAASLLAQAFKPAGPDEVAINLRWCKEDDGANNYELWKDGTGGCSVAAIGAIPELGVAALAARRRDVITAAAALARRGNCELAAETAAVCQCHNGSAFLTILGNPDRTCALLKDM